jgi:hypothetical protein
MDQLLVISSALNTGCIKRLIDISEVIVFCGAEAFIYVNILLNSKEHLFPAIWVVGK